MINSIILDVGIMVVSGFLAGTLANRFKLPRVSGYIIVGIILSPMVTGVIGSDTLVSLEFFTSVALGVIAYSIGADIRIPDLRRLERSIFWITPLQGLGAFVITGLVVALLGGYIIGGPGLDAGESYLPMALLLGAITVTTAPGVIVSIIHEYRARGPMTTILLSIVALDDAMAVIIFTIAIGVAGALTGASGGFNAFTMLALPVIGIITAIVVGAVLGYLLVYLSRLVQVRSLRLVIVFGAILVATGLSEMLSGLDAHLEVSGILTNMTLGFVIANKLRGNQLFEVIDDIEEVVFTVFFVLAGLHFNPEAMRVAGVLAVVIIICRTTGKYFGTRLGAKLSGAPPPVRKYLGLALLPSAGISIGLALVAREQFPGFGDIIFNAVITATIVYELVSPPLVKFALSRAKELGQQK